MRRFFLRYTVAYLFVFIAVMQTGATQAQSSYRAIATTNLNFRAGPGTQYQVLGSIPQGTQVAVFGCSEGYNWCDIDYSGQRGWASGKYLAVAESGEYYGSPLYSSGLYLGLPIWRDYPIYGPRPPVNAPPGYRPLPPRPTHPIVRPPRPTHPIAGPPGYRPPGARPPRPGNPTIRPPRPSHPTARPPSYSPRVGARPAGRPSAGNRGGGGGRARGGGGRGGRGGGRGR